jgi:hypothetical protein
MLISDDALPLLALEKAAVLELQQDLLEELLGDRLDHSEIRHEHRTGAPLGGEAQHRLQPVLRFSRQHVSID